MEAPILHITVLQGPKNGETLVCKPGSKIQIGRVIKGNDFSVRDAGISQKHLCFQFVPEVSRWFVSDLDSSNGTLLNGSQIEALVPVPVSNGDAIKIGEKTELGVKIVSQVVSKEKEEENNVKGRRVNTRSSAARVYTGAGSSRVSEEEEEAKEDESRVSVLARGRRNIAKVNPARVSIEEKRKEETLDPDFVFNFGAKTAQKGTGRGRRNNVKENSSTVLEEKKEGNRDLGLCSGVETEEADQSRGVKLRRNPRRGNYSRVLKELDTNCVANSGLEVKEVSMKRKGRGKGKETGVSEDEMRKRNENLIIEIDENCNSDCVIMLEPGKVVKARTKVNSSMVTEEEKGEEDIGVKERKEINCEEVKVDFENMTLEQWFDSMESFFPKVIHDESEYIINILKEKAKKFDEYLEAGGVV